MHTGGEDSRNCRDTPENFLEEQLFLFRRIVTARRGRYSQLQDVDRIEAWFDVVECNEAANHQSRADQQHNRECHLRHHQPGTKATVPQASIHALTAAYQPRVQVPTHSLDRGHQTAEQCGQEGQAQCKKQRRPIQCDDDFGGNRVWRNDGDDFFESEICKHTSGNATSHRQ